MSEITSFDDYKSKYNTGMDYSLLFSGMEGNSTTQTGSTLLSDFTAIKNGSYGKLLKAYYARQDAMKASEGKDTKQRLTLMGTSADSLKKSADALKSESLWQKKTIKTKNEDTGEETETEDYDWDAIVKAVKSFAEDYNGVIEEAGKSNTKEVLRNGVWLTKTTERAKNLLSDVGISVGKGNKLEVDEEALKKADIGTLKLLFTGHNSFADKVSQKAESLSSAAARGRTYTKSGNYSDALYGLVSGKIDEEV